MTEAQKLFLMRKIAPACIDELASPVLHSVLNDSYIQKWIYGAKGVGSQGDGTVQLLAKNKESQQKIIDYLNNERHKEAFGFQLNAEGKKLRKQLFQLQEQEPECLPRPFFHQESTSSDHG